MTTYAGDPSWPMIPLLADQTVPDGSTIDIPLEALADRTAFLLARLTTIGTQTISASGTITVPEGAVLGIFDGCGGGGGGGAGRAGDAAYVATSGGGGGGGAVRTQQLASVTPGESLVVTLGGGGVGGATNGAHGAQGASTTVVRGSSPAFVSFPGGSGGTGAINGFGKIDDTGLGPRDLYLFSPGGRPCGYNNFFEQRVYGESPSLAVCRETTPQAGGPGLSAPVGAVATYLGRGVPSPYTTYGGLAGTVGASPTADRFGGGAGGGGGAGAFGAGGSGGNGSSGNAGAATSAGTAGTAAAANSGGGGGGGGSSGSSGTGAPGAGGVGGAGGSGFLRITWIGRGA